jgi:hypothetical protein
MKHSYEGELSILLVYVKLKWLENELVSLQQGETMVTQYFTKAKSIYDEIVKLVSVRKGKEGSHEVI